MRLTKLYIHNYKSFYDTTIELDKMNIVVGENNSGKSNLIDVLEFVDIAMSKDIERAISDKGGYDNLKNYNADEDKIIIRATFYKDEKSNYLNYIVTGRFTGIIEAKGYITVSISFSKKYSILSFFVDVKSKCLLNNGLNSIGKDTSSFQQIKRYKKIKFVFSIKKLYDEQSKKREKLFIYTLSHKKYIQKCYMGVLLYFNFFHTDSVIISNYISTYYFNSSLIRSHSNEEGINELKKDGSNLGKNLAYIKETDNNLFEIISNSLITTVNEIDGIDIYNVAGSYIIAFKERDKEINIKRVSDGTINLLTTITALNQPFDSSSFLVFEEPERHLHLNAVAYLLEAFRDSEKQILITTHATEIIKYADLKEIIFIYRDSDGDTQSIRADAIPNLKTKMTRLAYKRDVTLDELIGEGMIGTFE